MKKRRTKEKMSFYLFIIPGRFINNRSHPLSNGRLARECIARSGIFSPNYRFAGFITRLIALVKVRVVRESDGNSVMRADRVLGVPTRHRSDRTHRLLMTLNQGALSMRRHGARLDYFPSICTHIRRKVKR